MSDQIFGPVGEPVDIVEVYDDPYQCRIRFEDDSEMDVDARDLMADGRINTIIDALEAEGERQ